jgi:hypothetical protein
MKRRLVREVLEQAKVFNEILAEAKSREETADRAWAKR